MRAGVVLLAVITAGCGGVARNLEKVQDRKDVYYLGDSFEGYDLEHVDGAFFVYGTCDPGPESGCAPPIQIQHFSFQPRMWAIAVGCTRAGRIRGVPAVHHDTLIALTRRAFVKIYATSDAQVRRAFMALRSTDGTVLPQEPLPRAAPRVIKTVLQACSPR